MLPVEEIRRGRHLYVEKLGFVVDWGDAEKQSICQVSLFPKHGVHSRKALGIVLMGSEFPSSAGDDEATEGMSPVEGESASVIENKPTHSSTPFMTVFDEVGYYTAQGMAVMAAQARLGVFTLRNVSGRSFELITSCEPCAMCLGATLWSGVVRVVCGAHRDDARRLDFEEGPVFPASHEYLEARGIEIVQGVLRDEANEVLELYRASKGTIYNR